MRTLINMNDFTEYQSGTGPFRPFLHDYILPPMIRFDIKKYGKYDAELVAGGKDYTQIVCGNRGSSGLYFVYFGNYDHIFVSTRHRPTGSEPQIAGPRSSVRELLTQSR